MGVAVHQQSGTAQFRLSDREMDVLLQLMEGKTSQEVADALCCTTRTVGFHLANIYKKMNVSNRIQAMRVALELGLVA